MNRVLAFVEEGGSKVLHAVEVVGHSAVCVERLLTDGQKLEPEVKAVLLKMVADGEAIATAVTIAGGAEGANFAADAAAVAAIRQFVTDFVAGLPTLKSAASALGADLKTA